MVKRQLVPYDGDTLSDIGEIPFSEYWKRCEDLLPEDWAMQLIAKPYRGFYIYAAVAYLDDEDGNTPSTTRGYEDDHDGHLRPRCSSTPERAIERLYYHLRDGLV